VFSQAAVTSSNTAMLDQWVCDLRATTEGVGLSKRDKCCQNNEEGTHLDENKRTKRMHSANLTSGRKLSVSKGKTETTQSKKKVITECQLKQR